MSGSYLDDSAAAEGGWRPVWENEPDETVSPGLPATAPLPFGSSPEWENIWLAPDALAPLLAPLCDAQDALARLDASASAAPEAVRVGLNARIAFSEAAGWLAFAHAWVDPRDLALKDLGLTGSYAIATRVGRPLRDLPNTYARACAAWDDQDFAQLLAGDAAAGTALILARALQRLLRTRENPFASLAAASATLSQFAQEPLDGARFAAWRSELHATIGTSQDDTRRAGEGGFLPLPALLRAARTAERWMDAGIQDTPTALSAMLAAAGVLVESGAVRAVIPPLWSGYLAIGRPGQGNGLPDVRGAAARFAGKTGTPPWPLAFLHLLAEGARAGLRDLERLLAVAERGRGVTTGRDPRSRLPAALDAVLRAPVVTPKALAAQLAIAPQTATALMRELRQAGLVAEITGRRSFRAFAAVSG